jgi:predicted small secreted protein
MKRSILLLALAPLLTGCATQRSNGAHQADAGHDPNSVYSDPTYPGPGVHFGVGLGTWGGRRGAGVGFGLGF